jgi:hypothetical protein
VEPLALGVDLMAAGDTMQGRRLPDDATIADMKPGDYLLRGARRMVWLCLPNGAQANLPVSKSTATDARTWGLVEHDDGSLSLSPSILLHPSPPADPVGWHGYLERGVWREV